MQCLSYSPNRRCCLWHAQEEGIKLNSTYVLTHTCNRSHFCLSPLPPSPSLPVPPPSCSSHSLLSLPFHHPFSLYCPSPGHHCCLSLSLALPLLPPPSFFPTPPSSSSSFSSSLQHLIASHVHLLFFPQVDSQDTEEEMILFQHLPTSISNLIQVTNNLSFHVI